MFYPFPTRVLSRLGGGVLLSLSAAFVLAEPEPEATPATTVSVPEWQSVFADYEAFQTQPVLSWQGVNRRVSEIGGWRTYAMEPYETEATETGEDVGNGSNGAHVHDAHPGVHQ